MPSTFLQLGVPEFICRALAKSGITEPFEIQAATLTDALAEKDICGRAPTGSGKTLAFGIPLVAKARRAEPKRPRAVVLAPTRELAEQIANDIRKFSGPVRVGVVYGGVAYGNQIRTLKRGGEILVACPGRLEDLINQKFVSLAGIKKVVIDEADRMSDMGFMPIVRRLLDQIPDARQTRLFSATLDSAVSKLTADYQRSPINYDIGNANSDVVPASHLFWKVARHDRQAITAQAITASWPSIVFCRTRNGADKLGKYLNKEGIPVAIIHGGRSQNQRTRAITDFSNNKVIALVASDVAARGIHIDGIASVIHYDIPEDSKAYVHRSGRTARAGEGGAVLTLVQPEQAKSVSQIQRSVGLKTGSTDPDFDTLRSLPSSGDSVIHLSKANSEQETGRTSKVSRSVVKSQSNTHTKNNEHRTKDRRWGKRTVETNPFAHKANKGRRRNQPKAQSSRVNRIHK